MSSPILCGIETEFGIFVRGADLTPMMASSLIVNAYSDEGLTLRVWDFASETPDIDALEGWRPEADYPEVEVLMANTVLTNGARFYVDHAHPEVSTPECRSVSDVVLYDRAAEEIIRRAMKRANERLPDGVELVLHKNNSDGKGNSYGCHENYLVPRSVPFGKIASYLTSHFVTRQTFTGAGKVGTECIREGETPASFQLSQRADFFEEEIGLETTVRRPIINTRDEPHCDPERWRRLHVIAGDANMSELATFLKVGTTALLLGMIEDDSFPSHLVIANPVREIRQVSHDPSLNHRIELTDGRLMTALQIQEELLESCKQWFFQLDQDPTNGDGEEIIALWATVLASLATNPMEVADVVDWVAKKRVLDAMQHRHDLAPDHPRLRAIDLQYHDMDKSRCLALRVGLRTRVRDADVTHAMTQPPTDTRAYFRGTCLQRWSKNVSSANWDSIVFDVGGPLLQRVPMMDPFKGTKIMVENVFSRASSVSEFLDLLGMDNVESVIEDPGW
jgi:proteasome accessory factor A